MKRSIILISMDKCSYEHEVLAEHLYNSNNVLKLSCIDDGFFVDYCYETDDERKLFIGAIMRLDVDRIEIYDVLYEEFLRGR